jgi:quercetin dioxygenase-like cupin family protein
MHEIMKASSPASPVELRHRITEFEDILLQHDQVDIPVTQYFCNGVYAREITIPAGTLITGKIHKHPCLSIVLTGKMEVITDEGPRVIVAPLVYESPAGVKRAGRALEDCRWITIHPHTGDELDAEAMAALLTVNTYAELEQFNQERLECQS